VQARGGKGKKYRVETLSEEAFEPFGAVLGGARPTPRAIAGGMAYSRAGCDYWNVHYYNAGHGGQTEVGVSVECGRLPSPGMEAALH
jgi:hypothetical protein